MAGGDLAHSTLSNICDVVVRLQTPIIRQANVMAALARLLVRPDRARVCVEEWRMSGKTESDR